jgi:RNA polymerase sigma factor (sigma-70 family)
MATAASSLTVEDLARRCREEAHNYRSERPYEDAYGLELFQRALVDRDQEAWRVLYDQYEGLVAGWIRRHSKFPDTQEEAEFLVNAAFVRLWRTAARRGGRLQFDTLVQVLGYLRRCARSAVEDEFRRRQRSPRRVLAWDELAEALPEAAPSVEGRVARRLARQALLRAVASRLQSKEEKVAARLSWVYGMAPREVRARRPDLFPGVVRVYQVKRNILNRLLRDAAIQQMLKQVR